MLRQTHYKYISIIFCAAWFFDVKKEKHFETANCALCLLLTNPFSQVAKKSNSDRVLFKGITRAEIHLGRPL